jgi:hypothetical protein
VIAAPVRRKVRRGGGARALVFIFKFIAVLFWAAAITALVFFGLELFAQAVPVDLNSDLSSALNSVLSSALDNVLVTNALIGFIVGFVFFGIGEIIGLLNDIRRNTW